MMEQIEDSKYYVTKQGLIYSTASTKFLKPRLDKDGYLLINLYMKGKRKTFKVHRLVAQHYLPNKDNLPQVNHIDGNKANNHISNLEWCDQKHNNKHTWNQGRGKNPLHTPGEENPNAKISLNDVKEIIRLREEEGLTLRVIAERFDISISHTCYISKKRQWV